MSRDRIYALPQQQVGNFVFDEQVAEVFPDMLARSVPGYASILSMIEQLAARFARPQTNIYDLGCSLGAATMLIRAQAPRDCVIHAVDTSPAMVRRLQTALAEPASAGPAQGSALGRSPHSCCPVEVHLADIRGFPLHNASFVVLNLTLQFIPPTDRFGVLHAISQALSAGGALLLTEKICFANTAEQELLTELHHDFKRAHGYSDLEIAQKRTAIENRLITETLPAHMDRLREVGFDVIVPWFQCFNFVSILAIHGPADPDA